MARANEWVATKGGKGMSSRPHPGSERPLHGPLQRFDLGAEVEMCMGEELEKHVFTRPTIISLPPGLVHCPLEITRVDRPIIQIEMMLAPPGGSPPTREPFFKKDKGFRPDLAMDVTNFSLQKKGKG